MAHDSERERSSDVSSVSADSNRYFIHEDVEKQTNSEHSCHTTSNLVRPHGQRNQYAAEMENPSTTRKKGV